MQQSTYSDHTLCICMCVPSYAIVAQCFQTTHSQLLSISRSNEANWLAGLRYITTLHSFYNSLCTKLPYTCTPAQENAAHVLYACKKISAALNIYINDQWHMHIKPIQSITHTILHNHTHTHIHYFHHFHPSHPILSLMPCRKTISVQGAVVQTRSLSVAATSLQKQQNQMSFLSVAACLFQALPVSSCLSATIYYKLHDPMPRTRLTGTI